MAQKRKTAKKSCRFLFVLAFAFAMTMFMTSAAFADAEVSDWAGLQGAFNNGEDAVLTDNITAAEDSKKLVVPNEKNVTLDLNGHTIDYSAAVMDTLHGVGGPAITVDGGSLTLKDSSTDAAGKITGGKCLTGSVNCGGGVLVNSGSFTMESGEISGNSAINGGGVFVGNNVTFTMKGGKISNNGNSNTGSLGGGVFVDGGKFLMEGGEISGNELGSGSLDWGGGVYVANGNFTMKGGKIADNKADNGGGVSTGYTPSANPSFIMEGGEISGNTAEKGGGVYLIMSELAMSGGTVSGNIGTECGGGVYLIGADNDPSTLKLAGNVIISDNKNSTASNAANSNVYIETTTAREKITLTGPLTEDASVGVGMKAPGVFTSSDETTHASDYAECFFSDNGELTVQAEGNELKLATADSYPVWVGATQVTKDNKNDILGDGKVTFNPATKTLTLDNPQIKDFYSGPNAPHASIYATQNNLKIEGSANLVNPDTTNEACGIYVSGGDVELNGDFTIKATYYGISASGGNITFSGGNVNVTSDAGVQGRNIEIKGGTLTSAAKHKCLWASNDITIGSGLSIVRPAGGQIGGDEYSKWVNDADGNEANVVVISSESDLKLVTFSAGYKDNSGREIILKADTVESGQGATAPETPTREGYTFNGWDTDFSNVTSDLLVTAKWKQIQTTYQVIFEDGLGKILGTQTVVKGRPATAPADPVREGYLFSGWDTDFSSVTSDLTVKAKWTEKSQEEGKYKVVFVFGFGNDPVVQTVGKGESATAPDIPVVEGFTFKDWDKAFTNVTDNLTVTAQWEKNTEGNKHTVVFVDGYSVVPLLIQRVEDGQAANPPEEPTREGYIFEGWDTDFSYVTEDLTVIAQWKEKTISIKNAKVVLSATAFAYNGKVRKPSIKKIGGKALKAGTDYTAKWSNKSSKNVGAYTVTITGKGKYTGVTKAAYKINPKGTSLKKPAKAKKAITVKWKKQSAKMAKSRITGYQIQLATNKKFTKNKKTVNVKGYKKVSKKVTNLKGGKTYYVKIRTYKTIKGKNYYSKWSKVKAVKTKK